MRVLPIRGGRCALDWSARAQVHALNRSRTGDRSLCASLCARGRTTNMYSAAISVKRNACLGGKAGLQAVARHQIRAADALIDSRRTCCFGALRAQLARSIHPLPTAGAYSEPACSCIHTRTRRLGTIADLSTLRRLKKQPCTWRRRYQATRRRAERAHKCCATSAAPNQHV